MTTNADSQRCIRVLGHLADLFEREQTRLNELDAALGDGDMGLTLAQGFQALREASAQWDGLSCSEILNEAGTLFGNAAPSTIGTLWAGAFTAAGQALAGKAELSGPDVTAALAAATAIVQRRGKAKEGDKTLLDALGPARAAAERAAGAGLALPELLEEVAAAARQGVEATRKMKARQGRARWFQERSVGLVDPGAEAVATLFRGCAEALRSAAT